MESYEDRSETVVDLETQALNSNGPDRIAHYIEARAESKKTPVGTALFQTGLVQLDSMLNGFRTGEVVVITGPTGNGKTLLADSIGQRLMRMMKINIAWFTYEVPMMDMTEKYANAFDAAAGNFQWFKLKCLEAKIKFNCRAIVLDHLHFLVDMSSQQNMSLNIGAVMRQIKHDIAKAMNLVVFVIAHQGQAKEGEPSIDNIRDSSFIGQEPDTVLIVYRSADPVPPELQANTKARGYQHTYKQGYATVKIDKARRSGVYRERLAYQKQGDWLEEA